MPEDQGNERLQPPTGSVLIVWAGMGLGAALAHRFAREGKSVAISARNPETIDQVMQS